MASMTLQDLPAHPAELAMHIANHPDTSMVEIMEPYRKFEQELRCLFAQHQQHPLLQDPLVNLVPLFTENTKHITTRARDLASESEQEKSRYIMPLANDKRRPHGSPATVASLAEFQKNFNVFSELSLSELDWSNVVAAGSSVINTLLPVPERFSRNKRTLRNYYHQTFCPASDVDLFLYGLTHDQAIDKIKKIERAVRDAVLGEITVVRTKYAITIASQYPVRHVQIVLRIYNSISEILTGFDIDAAGGAYDGKQVYVTPRALASFITQVNHIDLSRRSPSYENRLSKYAHRNFEAYWPELDRSRIDPTIFERSFRRTLGLARLLVLEKLPTSYDRQEYANKRRQEHGRPELSRIIFRLRGNIKDTHDDEIADWLSEDVVSNYHTFTVPYGPKFSAKKIEKLCYTRDLLLNAEWNQPKDRKVYLHRHPAFFGRVEDVVEDCCGCCPEPITPDEVEIAKQESDVYISGRVSFLTDDPGRQQIGSFNPLTDEDWTDMAYIGSTARLCQSIVDADVEDVRAWLSQEGADPNQRDCTGRAPLHLAVMTSTPDIVRCLVDRGSRITARLSDGKTALHLAAARGDAEMIRILMQKSLENEAEEEERQAARRQPVKAGSPTDQDEEAPGDDDESEAPDSEQSESESDFDRVENSTKADSHSIVTASFVKVKKTNNSEEEFFENSDEPDFFQIDIPAWDTPYSPLHLAIAEGHEDAVKVLCDYGADVLLPFTSSRANDAAILPLTLVLSLPPTKAKSMATLLLKLGATSSQADAEGFTAFYQFVASGNVDALDALLEHDVTGVRRAINHITHVTSSLAPIHAAIDLGDSALLQKLLSAGALAEIDFETWQKAMRARAGTSWLLGPEDARDNYHRYLEQPLISAIRLGNWKAATLLLNHGVSPNAQSLDSRSGFRLGSMSRSREGETALDAIRETIEKLCHYEVEKPRYERPAETTLTNTYEPGSYQHCAIAFAIDMKNAEFAFSLKQHEEEIEKIESGGLSQRRRLIEKSLLRMEELERLLVAKGALTLEQLHPDIELHRNTPNNFYRSPRSPEGFASEFRFHGDLGMTDSRRDQYIKLMQAAWEGDLETIKSLTLRAWGVDQKQAPLKIVITDLCHNSPFSIALLRGHLDVAKAILEIVQAQWSPVEKQEVRYLMTSQLSEGHDSEEDASNDDGSDDGLGIVSETIKNRSTIDDIGQVSLQVTSHTEPLALVLGTAGGLSPEINASSRPQVRRRLFEIVMDNEYDAQLNVLLNLGRQWAKGPSNPGDRDADDGGLTFPDDVFVWAINQGKVQALRTVIKETGAGMPLDLMVKQSGVKVEEKPRSYQGLTVYGKKRKDWAAMAGPHSTDETNGAMPSPLLRAAAGGCLASAKFFLSDEPHRLYKKFFESEAGQKDGRLKKLEDSPGGFDGAISRWLRSDDEYVIHCAVLACPSKESIGSLKHLAETCPRYLEKRNVDGDTPLLVACKLGQPQFIKTLIDAGANQSVRNNLGENVLHATLSRNAMIGPLRDVLDMLDESVRSRLFTERNNVQEDGMTPLHHWITQRCILDVREGQLFYRHRFGRRCVNKRHEADVVKLLLEYSKGEELEMLNAAGDTCLHTAIFYRALNMIKILVDFRPRLLLRENAVGRTPAELAWDRFKAMQFQRCRAGVWSQKRWVLNELATTGGQHIVIGEVFSDAEIGLLGEKMAELGLNGEYSILEAGCMTWWMGLSDLVPQDGLELGFLKRAVWDFCQSRLEREVESQRRLVSLNEASFVVERLHDWAKTSRGLRNRPSERWGHHGSSWRSRVKAIGREIEGNDYEDDEETTETREDDDGTGVVTSWMRGALSRAWEMNEFEAEVYGFKKCVHCGTRH